MSANTNQRDRKRIQSQRRAAICPIIGHLKPEFRPSKKALIGRKKRTYKFIDGCNRLELEKWLNHHFVLLLSYQIMNIRALFSTQSRTSVWMLLNKHQFLN